MRPRLIPTKLSVFSQANHLIERPRLIDKLVQGMHHKVTLIKGSAGFGKTSLAMQWRDYLINQAIQVAWLSLDEDDNNVERCINHIVAAIHSAEPSIQISSSFLVESQSQQTINYILIELVNTLHTANIPIYFILDDFHLIHNKTIQNALTFLIKYTPSNFHLVICTRVQPTLSIYTLRTKNQLFEIDIADLRFNQEELSAFFLNTHQLALSQDDIHTLWEKTEGWIASLQLILFLSRRGHSLKSLSDKLGENHSISEYLAENAIDSLSPDTLDFLLKTSILERLNSGLCNQLTQRSDSQYMLETLYKRGIFTLPLDPEFHWFQYHHLFSSFLRQRLHQQLPKAVNHLHCLASDWYADNDYTDEAVYHALAAKDTQKAIRLVEQRAMWWVEHSFMGTLLNLVDKLPAESIKTHAPLQMAIGWAHCLMHHQHETHAALDCVQQLITTHDTLSIEKGVLQATMLIYADRLDEVEALLAPCFAQKDKCTPWTLSVGYNVMTYVLLNTYRYQEAIQLQENTEPFRHVTQGHFAKVYGDCLSGLALLAQCQIRAAQEHFSRALDKACKYGGEHSHMAYLAGALLGHLYYEQNELDKAKKLLSRSRELGIEGGVADFYIATYCFSARLETLNGRFPQAYEILKEGLQIAHKLNIPRLDFIIRAELIKLFLLQGDSQAAQRTMQRLDETSIALSATPGIAEQMIEIRELARAHLLCKVGQCQQTIDMLNTILEETIKNARHYSQVKVRTALAAALEHAGHPQKAEEVLLPALETGLAHNMVRTFIDEGYLVMCVIKRIANAQSLPSLHTTTSNASHLNHYLLTLLRLFSDTYPTPLEMQTHTPALVEPLKEKEMQILKMLEKGLSNKEISKELHIGINTVKWYLKGIYTKLGVKRRTQAITEAKRLELL